MPAAPPPLYRPTWRGCRREMGGKRLSEASGPRSGALRGGRGRRWQRTMAREQGGPLTTTATRRDGGTTCLYLLVTSATAAAVQLRQRGR